LVAFLKTGQILVIFCFGVLIGCKKDLLDPNLVENKTGWFKNSLLHKNIWFGDGSQISVFSDLVIG